MAFHELLQAAQRPASNMRSLGAILAVILGRSPGTHINRNVCAMQALSLQGQQGHPKVFAQRMTLQCYRYSHSNIIKLSTFAALWPGLALPSPPFISL